MNWRVTTRYLLCFIYGPIGLETNAKKLPPLQCHNAIDYQQKFLIYDLSIRINFLIWKLTIKNLYLCNYSCVNHRVKAYFISTKFANILFFARTLWILKLRFFQFEICKYLSSWFIQVTFVQQPLHCCIS